MDKAANLFKIIVADLMRRKHLSQRALAEAMGVSQPMVQQYLATGKSSPGLDVLERFASALGVQAWELIKPKDVESTTTLASLGEVLLDQLSPAKRRLIELALRADDDDVAIATISLEGAVSTNPSTGSVSPSSKRKNSR